MITKFRAWHIGEQKMYDLENDAELRFRSFKYDLFYIYEPYTNNTTRQELIGNDKHFELMEYTGFEIGGKELYFGDIIQFDYDYRYTEAGETRVIMKDCNNVPIAQTCRNSAKALNDIPLHLLNKSLFKIIGHIHER